MPTSVPTHQNLNLEAELLGPRGGSCLESPSQALQLLVAPLPHSGWSPAAYTPSLSPLPTPCGPRPQPLCPRSLSSQAASALTIAFIEQLLGEGTLNF